MTKAALFAMRDFARQPDARFVEMTGKENFRVGEYGHVSFDVKCPWCSDVCWLHFGLEGNGRFICKPCGAIGSAEHGEYMGKREVELTLEGQVEGEEQSS